MRKRLSSPFPTIISLSLIELQLSSFHVVCGIVFKYTFVHTRITLRVLAFENQGKKTHFPPFYLMFLSLRKQVQSLAPQKEVKEGKYETQDIFFKVFMPHLSESFLSLDDFIIRLNCIGYNGKCVT